MRYYTPSHYTGKIKQKKIFRIVLLTLLILGILAGLAVLGNLLRERLVRAQSLLDLSPEDYSVQPNASPTYEYTKPPMRNPHDMRFVCAPMSPAVFAGTDALNAAFRTAAEAYRGISVTVSDATGLYFAIGDAAENAALKPSSLLGEAVSAADAYGLHVSATVHTSYSARQDAAILTELARLGITETVICGLTRSTLTDAQTHDLLLYLEMLREAAPQMTVGLSLSPSLLSDADTAPHLATLAAYFDFLLLDVSSAESADYAASLRELLSSLYGSLSYYDLAVLIDGEYINEALLEILHSASVQTVRCLY